jgi:hypothetical protein
MAHTSDADLARRQDVTLRADAAVVPEGAPRHVRGALAVARGARAFSERAKFSQPALVNGAIGIVVAPRGRLLIVLDFEIRRGKIFEIDVIADPARLRQVELAVLDTDHERGTEDALASASVRTGYRRYFWREVLKPAISRLVPHCYASCGPSGSERGGLSDRL